MTDINTSLFYIISISGLLYFLIINRRFDAFTLAYISAVFYFSPGFFGFVPTYSLPPTELIVPQTYLIMNLVLFFILCSAFIYDSIFANSKIVKINLNHNEIQNLLFFNNILLIMSISAFVLNTLTVDVSMLAGGAEKRDLLGASTLFYNFWVYPAILVCCISFFIKKWNFFFIGAFLLLLDMYLYAIRAHFILTFIAITTFYFFNLGKIRLIRYVRYFIILFPIFLFLFAFKSFIRPLNDGDYALFFERLFDADIYIYWLTRAEPFNQVAILNKVIYTNFSSPIAQISQAFFSLVPYSGYLDIGIKPRFHEYFHHVLYPHTPPGAIANNPWAQMYSMYGTLMVIASLFFYTASIFLINVKIFFSRSNLIKFSLFIVLPILCFYAHRNDIYFTVLMSKRLFLPLLGSYFLRLFYIQLMQGKLRFN
tara:strand:- start:186 stop:1460 length:1275 start_codon:yes stop_codon:yes gene_type:complete